MSLLTMGDLELRSKPPLCKSKNFFAHQDHERTSIG